MDREKEIDSIQRLISTGQTQEAIALFKNMDLRSSQKRILTVIEGEWVEVLKSEQKGTLAYHDLQLKKNQINDKLLGLLEKGSEAYVAKRRKSNIILIASTLVSAVLTFGVVTYFFSQDNACPPFDESQSLNSKILIMPFDNLGGKEKSPEIALRKKINQLAQKQKLSASAEIYSDPIEVSLGKANSLCQDCDVDILVWGGYESSDSDDSTRLVISYFFAEEPDSSILGKLVVVKSLTDLFKIQGLNTTELDAARILCTLIALVEGNKDAAIKWLKDIEPGVVDEKILELLEEKNLGAIQALAEKYSA